MTASGWTVGFPTVALLATCCGTTVTGPGETTPVPGTLALDPTWVGTTR